MFYLSHHRSRISNFIFLTCRDKRHGSRLDRKVNFDFAGRKIVEDDTNMSGYDPSKDEIVKNIMMGKSTLVRGDAGSLANPSLPVAAPKVCDLRYLHICDSFKLHLCV